MSESKPNAIENLQARTKYINNYELACKDCNHLVSICNDKEVELKMIRYQLEKGIRVIEKFLNDTEHPLTSGFERTMQPLVDFVENAKAELKLWEDER
jgi:hypothetical protein